MTFRLKNRELQKALDSISNGDFTKQLETEAKIDIPPFDSRGVVRVDFGDFKGHLVNRYSASFERNELEKVIEFNPKKWNEWPRVDPPVDVLMRAVVKEAGPEYDGPEHIFRPVFEQTCAYWDGDAWCYSTGGMIYTHGRIVRFRPWEDK